MSLRSARAGLNSLSLSLSRHAIGRMNETGENALVNDMYQYCNTPINVRFAISWVATDSESLGVGAT
jgi:ribose 1,5-bisphosphokinase PhnN